MKTVVTIASNDVSTYAQVMRAALSGSNACAKLHDREHMDMFLQLMSWAQDMHQEAVNKSCGMRSQS